MTNESDYKENLGSYSRSFRVLFIGGETADYLSMGVLNGLLSIPEIEVIDFPSADLAYVENEKLYSSRIRGNGFSLFFLNSSRTVDRFHLAFSNLDEFDLVIFADIHTSFGLFLRFLPKLRFEKTAILDGSDSPSLYPYNGNYWRRPYYWTLPRAHTRFRYFKREWTLETVRYRCFKLLPSVICRILRQPKLLRKTAFSIPQSKIFLGPSVKTKLFQTHIVDAELASTLPNSKVTYSFSTENEYYRDLQTSRFGVTTKRSGWDCLRHYEIAANGAVPCFRDLVEKPASCAPHGLVDGVNCISYRNVEDLNCRIQISHEEYSRMRTASLKWALANSCKQRALELIREFYPNFASFP